MQQQQPATPYGVKRKVTFDTPSPVHDTDHQEQRDQPLLPIAEDNSASSSSNAQPSASSSSHQQLPDEPRSNLDETIEYFNSVSHGWSTFLTTTSVARSKLTDTGIEENFDYMQHAIADARRVLLASETENLSWSASEAFIVAEGPLSQPMCFYYDFIADQCFSVSQEDLLTEDDVINYFDYVEEADRKEIQSFVNFKIFKLDLSTNSTNTVDAVWVRKWLSRNPPEVKSRCCGRGFLDIQKKGVGRHSSTASMLSHRLAMTMAAQHPDWTIEGFDVKTAFLQGLRFTEIEDKARELGIEIKEQRQVWLRPPANVWRHLRHLKFCQVQDCERFLFVLKLLKALYGLVDGPLLFQLAFLGFFVQSLSFRSSLHDENFLFLNNVNTWELVGIIILHVDDALVFGSFYFIRWVEEQAEKKFGKLKRHTLPLTWCGIVHEQLSSSHYFCHQKHYLERLKPMQATQRYADGASLADADYSAFRSIVMSLLWLCRTRTDIIFDVVSLQTKMHDPKGKDIKYVNTTLRHATNNSEMNGLHFMNVGTSFRLAQITDSGHITQHSCYPIEGRMVLLLGDQHILQSSCKEEYFTGNRAADFGGPSCVLFVSCKKASRVSYSTSHSETNPAVSCSAVAAIIANRITEIDYYSVYGKHATARDLLRNQALALNHIAVDLFTDAMNLFELICYSKSLPNDKHHRVGILALREDRLTRRIRNVIHVPTGIMLADPLTKSVTTKTFMRWATTGIWNTALQPDSNTKIRIRRSVKRPRTYTEHDLIKNNYDLSDGNLGEQLHLNEAFHHALTLVDDVDDNMVTSNFAHRFGCFGQSMRH